MLVAGERAKLGKGEKTRKNPHKTFGETFAAMSMTSTLRRAPMAAAVRGLLATWSGRLGGRVRPPHHHLHHHRAASASPFSSLSAPQPSAASDAHLLRIINFEISYAQKDCKNRDWAKELGEGFPFEIHDKEGTNRITLTRSDQREQIEVEVFLPSPVDAALQNDHQEDQAEDCKHQSRTSNGVPNQYCIPLIVRIRKGLASCLEISCSSYPAELIIESLEFGPSDESGGSLSGGTAFSNIPGGLQKALYSYLRSRGISTDFTNFLHAYMINKECHEYLSWLRKLKGLIKS